ncbi:hypothetical protein ACHHV8_24705 [Paenibacillus sp. TAB 01]|uniref:hypothetical protein n=1 Tax=Paenibacillus sp. TAB 01 TaxID=3368988 RepID=UPI003751D35B
MFSKINYLLIRTGAVLWPGAFGGLIEAGHFASPFLITAALQSAAAWLYARVHRAPKDISGGHGAR